MVYFLVLEFHQVLHSQCKMPLDNAKSSEKVSNYLYYA